MLGNLGTVVTVSPSGSALTKFTHYHQRTLLMNKGKKYMVHVTNGNIMIETKKKNKKECGCGCQCGCGCGS